MSQRQHYGNQGLKHDPLQASENAAKYVINQNNPTDAAGELCDDFKPGTCHPKVFGESVIAKAQDSARTSSSDTEQVPLSREHDVAVGLSSVPNPLPKQRTEPPAVNIVVFGETGVGKSSVINLIANQDLAHTSNDAVGCTFRCERYSVALDDTLCTIWDTAGLDEGSEGTVPAKEAENSLKELIQELARSGGIHLVMYCVRGTRLTRALRRNYDLFYVMACRKKVPVTLVVTGLEYQPDGMDSWWRENELELRRNGMSFDAHACITTLKVADEDIRRRRLESRDLLHSIVVKYSGIPGWKAETSLLTLLASLFHDVFRGAFSSCKQGEAVAGRKVLICGPCPWFFSGTTAANEKGMVMIGDRQYELYRIDKAALGKITPEICDGVGLLLFCSSTLADYRTQSEDVDVLKKFYQLAGGQSRPVIVALEGCRDEQIARACQVEVGFRYSYIQARFVAIPNPNDGTKKLDEVIDQLCLEQVEVKALSSAAREK